MARREVAASRARRVLDVGCGTGAMSLAVDARVLERLALIALGRAAGFSPARRDARLDVLPASIRRSCRKSPEEAL